MSKEPVSLYLNGAFWGPCIRNSFVREIEWTRRAVLDHMLPSIPDPNEEGDKAANEAWKTVMSTPSDGEDDPGDYAEWADMEGYEVYTRLKNVRQAAVNMTAVMLWHLMEQQMLFFHMRQVLDEGEEQLVLQDSSIRKELFNLNKFHNCLENGGCSMKSCPSWPKVDELRILSNAIKHWQGPSLDRLYALRPDLFELPGSVGCSLEPCDVGRPACGEDLCVSDADVKAYFDASINLWQEFCDLIEKHSP